MSSFPSRPSGFLIQIGGLGFHGLHPRSTRAYRRLTQRNGIEDRSICQPGMPTTRMGLNHTEFGYTPCRSSQRGTSYYRRSRRAAEDLSGNFKRMARERFWTGLRSNGTSGPVP